jgi:hypothetical protein
MQEIKADKWTRMMQCLKTILLVETVRDGGLGSLVVIEGSCDEGKPASREQQLLSRAK